MGGIDPSIWLEYGTMGAALLLMFMNFGFTVWVVRNAFSLVERFNKTMSRLLARLEEEE